MWEDILKRRKFYGNRADSLINEVFTGKIVGADFKKVKKLLEDEDLDVRFHVEIQVQRGEFEGLFTIKVKTFSDFLKELSMNIVRKYIRSLNREFDKNKDTIRIYSTDV